MIHLFCFGFGYSAYALARRLIEKEKRVRITGTTRSGKLHSFSKIQNRIEVFHFDSHHLLNPLVLDGVTHILVSIPPGDGISNKIVEFYGTFMKKVTWVGYLSTTGVYGNTGGMWVDETTPVNPRTKRAIMRVIAEGVWQTLQAPVHLFRLAGIYGNDRSAIDALRRKSAHRLAKPNHVSCRIHEVDLALVLETSMRKPNPGAIYNVCDDEPAPPKDVVAHAATLLNIEAPPLLSLEEANCTLSPLALSFYTESRRVCNTRIKRELSIRLHYPTYREGLASCLG